MTNRYDFGEGQIRGLVHQVDTMHHRILVLEAAIRRHREDHRRDYAYGGPAPCPGDVQLWENVSDE